MCFDRLVTGCDQVLSKKQDLLYRIVEQELQFFLLHIVSWDFHPIFIQIL